MQEVDFPLTEAAILDHLMGREVYRRTDFLALRNGPDTAVVMVAKQSLEPLFSPVTDALVLSTPDETAYLEDPTSVDVGNATALAKVADPNKLTTVVVGMFSHVNFLYRPAPIRVRVTEVVPPHPPKLLSSQAAQVVAFDEDSAPGRSGPGRRPHRRPGRGQPGGSTYLLPCRGSGCRARRRAARVPRQPARPVASDWLLIGCERSLQFHRHFYGDEPPQVDLCPRAPAGRRPAVRRRSNGVGADQVLPDGARHRDRRSLRRGPLGRETSTRSAPDCAPCCSTRRTTRPGLPDAGAERRPSMTVLPHRRLCPGGCGWSVVALPTGLVGGPGRSDERTTQPAPPGRAR